MELTKYQVNVTFTTELLGVVPKNAEVYKTWVELKAAAQADEEPPEVTEEHSWTGFHSDEQGLYLMDYMVKGFFKEAASTMPKVLGALKKSGESVSGQVARGRLDKWLFILPRRIYLGVSKEAGNIERPLRAKTLQGDRIALARSDYVSPGTKIEFTVVVLDDHITETALREWLSYGELMGIGQFRTGGYGRFTAQIERLAV